VITTSTLLFGGFLVFLLLSVPIGISLGLAILLYMIFGNGMFPISLLTQSFFTSCDSFPLMAVPFFILAGAFMECGGLSKRLIDFAYTLVGFLPNGLAVVTVITCMFFGAISGSSPATVAAIGSIMIPAMVSEGYSKSFSTGLAASAGGLGVIIPPSIPMVIYGVAANASVGNLFIAGIIPGVVCAGMLIVAICMISHRRVDTKKVTFSLREVFKSAYKAKEALFVPILILGGIYGGIFTPTEASAVAVLYGLLVGRFVYKELNIGGMKKSIIDSAVMTSAILIIVGPATTLGKILTAESIPSAMIQAINSLTDNKILILIFVNLILLLAGCVLDTLGAILVLTPILYPLVQSYGIDVIHFGIIMIVNLAIGFITPPVGMNLFVASSITGLSIEKVSKAAIPFMIALLGALMIITYIPEVTLFLLRVIK